MDATYIRNHIRDEVEGAKGYLALYEDTNDIQALHMSVDELSHAKYFLDKAEDLPETVRLSYNEAKKMIYDVIMRLGEEGKKDEEGEHIQDGAQT